MEKFIKKLKIVWWRIKSICAIYYYGHPSKKLKIIGVTGTNGKTTTATLLYRIATELGYKAGLIGTVENLINGEKRTLPSNGPQTSPDRVALTRLLRDMVDADCEYVFMEVSSHAMDQNRLWGIYFTGGIFSNLTHDHLDYHKDFDDYFNAKKKFFKILPENAFALSNVDDEYGKKMLEGINARKFLYEFSNIGGPASLDESFQGEILKMDFSGTDIAVAGTTFHTKLLGKFNAYNLLAVWSASKLLGFDMSRVKKILEDIKPPRGRFEHFTSRGGVIVVVDYAHTPDALENVLKTAREIKPENSRIISLFGCGGDRDPMKRPKMGKIGAELSDIAIFTSDNPRSEDPDKIIEAMKTDLSPELMSKVRSITNRRDAIQESVKIAKSGDIILCAGKGHEDYQEIKGVKSHFDDIEEYKKAF